MLFLPPRNQSRPADDPIFALNKEAVRRRAAGERVINATVGALQEDDGTLAVLPSVVEALRSVPAAKGAGYAPIGGNPEFQRAAIDDLLGGSPLAAHAVAVATPGGTGALRHAVSTFLERGQTLLTTSFFWGPYATICDEHERAIRTFEMFDAAGGFHGQAFADAVDTMAREQGRVVLFLNDPCHNPTGYSLSDDEWRTVREVLEQASRRVSVVVLVDVAYRAYGRTHSRFLEHLAPLADHALVLFAWSASKAFTQYGLRVGALIACTADAEERQRIENALVYACRATWSNCSAGGQVAIERCLRDAPLKARVDAERERLRELLAQRVEAFNRAAQGTSLRYPRYDGGFFVTVFTKDAPAKGLALQARGVFTVPQKGALRVALCGVSAADVPTLVAAMDETLRG